MTELVIKDHRVDYPLVPVEAGQLRTDGEILVLITKVESRNKYTVTYLQHFDKEWIFRAPFAEPRSGDSIIDHFPHVIENARITVDLNEV